MKTHIRHLKHFLLYLFSFKYRILYKYCILIKGDFIDRAESINKRYSFYYFTTVDQMSLYEHNCDGVVFNMRNIDTWLAKFFINYKGYETIATKRNRKLKQIL